MAYFCFRFEAGQDANSPRCTGGFLLPAHQCRTGARRGHFTSPSARSSAPTWLRNGCRKDTKKPPTPAGQAEPKRFLVVGGLLRKQQGKGYN